MFCITREIFHLDARGILADQYHVLALTSTGPQLQIVLSSLWQLRDWSACKVPYFVGSFVLVT